MTKNPPPTGNRRQQIVAATLELLQTTPLESVSTRKIARRLGITQPALFRHFRSRDELLLAVVERTRTDLGAVTAGILSGHDAPSGQLRALATALLRHAEQNPGLPRLLFSLPAQGEVATALRHLVSMQTSLATELFRQGQDQGLFNSHLDPRQAGRLFTALIQGLVLQWQMTGRQTPLAPQADALIALWLDGVHATQDRAQRHPEPRPASQGEGIVALDVRPLLARGEDPLDEIMAAVDRAGSRGIVKVTVPFRPDPLLALLDRQGHTVVVGATDEKTFSVDILVDGGKIEDLRALEPPEPLERVLQVSASMQPGEVFVARLPRYPRLLIKHLEDRGLVWTIHDEEDGSALLRLSRPS